MSSSTELINKIIEKFVEDYPVELSVVLLQIVAHPEHGGKGYRIEMFNPIIDIDGWEVDHNNKLILIDKTGLIFHNTISDYAKYLKKAIETEFLGTRERLLPRLAWGTGKIIFGVVEGTLGVVGIIIPEPGTTVAGIIVVTLATNNIVDGFSQLAGANQGHGVNLLSEGFGHTGAAAARLFNIDPATGYNLGQSTFAVTSIMAGSLASIKILRVPGKVFIGTGVGGQPGGVYLGRLSGLYSSNRAGDGLTILNIDNNAGKSILRFVTHNNQLMVNGRIFAVEKVLVHETNPKAILRGLLKLLVHGAKY